MDSILKGKKVLVIYDSSDVPSLLAAVIADDAYRAGTILINVNGKSASEISVAIEEVDSVRDYVMIFAPPTAAGDDSVLSYSQIAEAFSHLATTSLPEDPYELGATQDGSDSSTVVLATTASATNDHYNGMFINIGTEWKMITDYNGTTKVATIAGEWEEIPAEETDYVIHDYDNSYFHDHRMHGLTGRSICYYAWETIRPGIKPPPIVHLLGEYKKWVDLGTMQTGTKVQATKHAGATVGDTQRTTNNFFAGMKIFIVGGTGLGKSALITAYNGSTKVLTLDPAITTSDTSVYRITQNEVDIFADLRLRHAILTYLPDVDPSGSPEVTGNWKRLINKDSKLESGSLEVSYDAAYLNDLINTVGKSIVDYQLI